MKQEQIIIEEKELLVKRIEEKRRMLEKGILGRDDLLKQSGLSEELDHLIGQYMERMMQLRDE